MKLPVVLLATSLAANAALYVVVSHRQSAASSATSASSSRAENAANTEAGLSSGGDAAHSSGAASAANTAKAGAAGKAWDALHDSDLNALAAKLRAAGYPTSVVRAIIGAEISERFAARRKELIGSTEDTPFWKQDGYYAFLDPKKMAAIRDLYREQTQMFKDVLGPDAIQVSDEARASQRRRFGDLPPEKVDQLTNILSDYNEMKSEIYAASRGITLPEDREKLAYLDKEQRADLAKVLTPQELEEYDLRSSPTANRMRSQLGIFKPTEEEFRAIFKVQKALDDADGSSTSPLGITIINAEQTKERQAKQQEIDAQVQTLLSPDRFALYKQATDPAASMTNRLVARLDLPPQAALDTMAIQRDISQRAMATRTDRSLTPEQRNAQLAALSQEATTKLTNTLGERGLEAYRTYGGVWLANVQPRTMTRPAATPGTPASTTTTATPAPKG
jgi:hypothetical protein